MTRAGRGESKMGKERRRAGLGVLLFLLLLGTGTLKGAPKVMDMTFQDLGGGSLRIDLRLSEPLSSPPRTFSLAKPPTVSLDLPGAEIGMDEKRLKDIGGLVQDLRLAKTETGLRLVAALKAPARHTVTTGAQRVLLTLIPAAVLAPLAAAPRPSRAATPAPAMAGALVTRADFRKIGAEGRIVLDFGAPVPPYESKREDNRLVVNLRGAGVAPGYIRRFDVTDFATPVSSFDLFPFGRGARLEIEGQRDFQHTIYSEENKLVIDIAEAAPTTLEGAMPSYSGKNISLNLQDVDIRSALQTFADFTGLNVVTSDSVTGRVTVNLRDVPWDQALDVLLQSKNLGKRMMGKVIIVAPMSELKAREEIEEPPTEAFRLKYQKAPEIADLLAGRITSLEVPMGLVTGGFMATGVLDESTGGAGAGTRATLPIRREETSARILTPKGRAFADAKTNTLFVQDIASNMERIRKLIASIDVPMRQVLIESRIVEATDQFSRRLGSRFGVRWVNQHGRTGVGLSGHVEESSYLATSPPTAGLSPQNLQVSLPIMNTAGTAAETRLGSFALSILHGDVMVDAELQALETDALGRVISRPKVVTANLQKAMIEQGVQIPYMQQAGGLAGGTTVSFKDAVLSLGVTPQITPDDKVLMEIEVRRDEPDYSTLMNNIVGPNVVSQAPAINTRAVQTQVLVNNGDTAVLGGIFETTDRDELQKVPYLADIPIFGHLFRNKTHTNNKNELLIFITPKVLPEDLSVAGR